MNALALGLRAVEERFIVLAVGVHGGAVFGGETVVAVLRLIEQRLAFLFCHGGDSFQNGVEILVGRAPECVRRPGVLENGIAARAVKIIGLLRVDAKLRIIAREAVARHDARDARFAAAEHADRPVAEAGKPGLEEVDRVDGEQPPPGGFLPHKARAHGVSDVEEDDLVELREARFVGKDERSERFAPQLAVRGKCVREGRLQLPAQRRALG